MPPPSKSSSQCHIAGIGISERISTTNTEQSALSAGTKALLDAGITYRDVDHSIAASLDSKVVVPKTVFNVFGEGEGIAPVSEVDGHLAFFTGVQCVKSRSMECVLVVGLERVGHSIS
jgi:3-oxoacyl-[acyl-carrier-protein] synthase III